MTVSSRSIGADLAALRSAACQVYLHAAE